MKFLFSVLVLCSLIVSCSKVKKCKNYTPYFEYTQDPSLNAYNFKEGSYWVYKNPVTLEIDSQRVISALDNSYWSDSATECSGGSYLHEQRIGIKSFLSNSHYDLLLYGAGIYMDTSAAGSHKGRLIFAGNGNYSNPEAIELVETIPSLTINGNVFNNVRKVVVHNLANSIYNLADHDLFFYFADSVGIIKTEKDDGNGNLETWEIQSWQVLF